jgi:hypothetical protein
MSDSQEKLGAATELGKSEADLNSGKMNFTPPVLHKYGEVARLCRAAPTQGQNDFFTS